jgi:hypothetical protein
VRVVAVFQHLKDRGADARINFDLKNRQAARFALVFESFAKKCHLGQLSTVRKNYEGEAIQFQNKIIA